MNQRYGQFLEAAIDALEDTFFLFDPAKGKALRWNRAFAEISGYSDEEIAQLPAPESYYSPDDLKRANQCVQTALTNGRATVKLDLICKDGHTVTTEYNISTITDDQDQSQYIISIGRNVAERELTKAKLQAEQIFTDTIIRSMPGLFYIFKKDSASFLRRGGDWEGITGYTEKEIDSLTAFDLVGDRELCAARMQEVYDHGVSFMENTLLTKSGEQIPYFFSGSRLEVDGKVYLVGLGLDLSERNKALKALQESEKRFALAMDATRDGLWDWNVVTDEVYYSPGYTAMLGYEPGELPAQLESWSNLIHPEDKDVVMDVNMDCIENKCDDFSVEFRIQAKDGQWIWILGRGKVASRDESGKATRLILTHSDITERKLAEEKLSETTSFLDTIVDMSPFAMFVTDSKGTLIRSNRSLRTTLNATNEQIVGLYNVFNDHNLEKQGVMPLVRKVFEKHQPIRFDIPWKAEDSGEERLYGAYDLYIDVSMFPILDNKGQLTNMVCQWVDITEKKRGEEKLSETTSFLDTIVNMSPFAMWVSDSKGTLIRCNQTLRKALNVTNEQIIGRYNVFNDNNLDKQGVMPLIRKVYEKHHPVRFDIPWKAEDSGEVHFLDASDLYIDVAMFPILDSKGKLTNVVCQWVDITEKKRVEEAMEKRIIALTSPIADLKTIAFEELFNIEDIQQLQDQFAEATGVASIITHVDGTPITSPSNFCRLCSDIIRQTEKGRCNCFKSDAEIGRYNPDGPIIRPCLSGGLWDAGAAITVGGRHIANWLIGQVRDETQTEDKMRAYAREIDADEQQMVEAFREVPAMSSDQFEKVSRALYTLANQLSTSAYQNIQQARFISERKNAEAERETLIHELEEKNQEMERLIYTVSHDMKSPLVTIGGYLGMVKNDIGQMMSPQTTSDFENIENAAGRMRELLDDLLELSRIGRLVHTVENISLQELAEQAVQFVAGHLADSHIRIHIAPDLPVIKGDRSRMLELLQNLIENAIKYSGDQTHPTIEIGCRPSETDTVFFVKDNGMGIDPQYHDRVFKLFEQLNPKESEGTGAGLAIVKRIVETFQGDIWIESPGRGQGTTFCFTLPDATL